MPDAAQPESAPTPPSPAEVRAMLSALPRVRTALGADEIERRAARLSERGKLPGYRGGVAGALFECAAFGNPFDYRLVARLEGGELRFEARLRARMPAVFWAVMAFTVWPGVIFTDSLLNTWFGWYPNETWVTYAWYVPLTLLPLPWVHRRLMRRTRLAALVHAHEQIGKIAGAVDGEVVE